ncbi:recombinase family protein [Turicibacter sanguinis]|uniref:recombinase family protein n=1 Tax=Turicibacter sanguinis TaxID=154288 RepID=UPI00232EB138|nr:recombinase family protein [Turicibacter sanguinis]MDB8545797.1 recombinase family protein [Turicibacter sanguinis]
MIYGYCRVSSKGQLDGNSLEGQKEEILNKYSNAIIYQEQFTGKTTDRPIFNDLIQKLQKGDTLVVTKLDRFCRSTDEGLKVIKDLQKRGVDIHIMNMGLIENTPMGELIVTNLLAFAQFERAMILERTQNGKAIARERGDLKEGRPRKFNPEKLNEALDYVESGHSFKKAAEIFGISKATLVRRMQERKAKNTQEE